MKNADSVLARIESPADLKELSEAELEQLAAEMRTELIGVVGRRSAHFASNLGVVELCLALHLTFDFTQDRLIWDTGHQIYPHKLITGRSAELHTIRTKGGLMGYPNPAESPYDLFMTGHAGCAPSTALGLKVGDELMGRPHRHTVAVIGDGALPSGIVFEAFNNAGGLKKKLLVILNDNKMSICPRVGGLADYLDRARMSTHLQRLEQAGEVPAAQHPPGRRARRALAPAVQGRDQGLAAPRHALRGAGLPLPRPDRRPRPEDVCAATSRRSRRWTGPSCCTS